MPRSTPPRDRSARHSFVPIDLRRAAAARDADLAQLHHLGPWALAALGEALRASGFPTNDAPREEQR
jgi:hypothetical protein